MSKVKQLGFGWIKEGDYFSTKMSVTENKMCPSHFNEWRYFNLILNRIHLKS